MISNLGWTRLQKVADYRTVRKILRFSGTGSAIFGAVWVISGLMAPVEPVAVVIGVVLIGTGLWNMTAPKPAGIVFDGVTLVMVGAYNIVTPFMAAAAGQHGAGGGFWVKVGIFQIIWGVQGFVRYVKFKDAFRDPPTDSELQQLDHTVTEILRAKVNEVFDVIEFKTHGLMSANIWKARLSDDGAVLVTAGGREARAADKSGFEIVANGKSLIGRSVKATFTIAGKSAKGTISQEGIDRYQMWKTGAVVPRPYAA